MGQVDGEGLPRQREAIERAAAAHSLTLGTIFEEHGISGTTEWADRPAWIDMMAQSSPGDTVIIERLDRLARDLGVQEHILRDLKRLQIVIISAAEPDLGSTDPTRILFRQILGAIAQFDRAQIEAKLRHARDRQRRKTGRCEGRKPFGHRGSERAALQAIRELRDTGYTMREIADKLNENQVVTRTGAQWHHGTVAKILSAGTGWMVAEVASPQVASAVLPCEPYAPGEHLSPGVS